jgi:hypothetical protein
MATHERDQRRSWWFVKEGVDVYIFVNDPRHKDKTRRNEGFRFQSLKTKKDKSAIIGICVSRSGVNTSTKIKEKDMEEGLKVSKV